MRFYTKQHRYYCGIDLHARSMYLCILDTHGEMLLPRARPILRRTSFRQPEACALDNRGPHKD